MEDKVKKQLISAAKEGDNYSLIRLYEHLRPTLYAKALIFFGYGDEAKDALQETFIKVFSKIHTLKNSSHFNTWVHAILWNQCLLMKRDQRKLVSDCQDRQSSGYPVTLPSADKILEQQDVHENLSQLVAQLSEKKRMVVLLRFFSEFNSYREIAEILDIPVGTVRSRLASAKTTLRAMVSDLDIFEQYTDRRSTATVYENKFRELWPSFYKGNRERFLSHFDPGLSIRFSSGKTERGIRRWAEEWDMDLVTGVRFKPNYVINSGNLAIVEGPIINPPDKPFHCPPEGSLVFFHRKGTVYKTHVHYATRKSAE